jgi:hypothetical protein
VLDEPFRERLRVVQGAPGDAELSTRLTVARVGAPVLVHWEVARDARFLDIERYGLFFAHHQLDYQVRVGLQGLSPGRGYWARLWAGGSWSPTVRVHTESYAMQFARARATHSTRPLRRVLDGVGSVRGISLLPRGRGRPHARTNTGPGSPGADGTGGSLIGAGSSFGGSSSGRGSSTGSPIGGTSSGGSCAGSGAGVDGGSSIGSTGGSVGLGVGTSGSSRGFCARGLSGIEPTSATGTPRR